MKKTLIIFCCLIGALAAEQKISLDDIERDTLHNEKITKLSKSPSAPSSPPSPPQGVKLPQPSPAQYGFVPLKTAQDYVQQEPTGQYVYNQQFFASRNNKPGVSPIHLQLYQQYQRVLQKQQELKQLQQQQLLRQQQQQLQQLQSQKYVAAQPQYVVPPVQSQQYVVPQQYVVQPQAHQKYLLPAQTAYKQNVQYVTDNHIATQPRQYYGGGAAAQQYVYLQQYTQPSNTVQTVVDPKAGVQYVMYVPAVVPQAYENVVYVDAAQYATQQQQQQQLLQQQYVQQPHVQQPQVQVRPRTRGPQPKSLLDSYIPSHLQLQYLKQQQQQAQANALRLTLKQSAVAAGKGQSAKGAYKEQEEQGQSGESETTLDYDYQLPYYQPGIPGH